MFERIFRRSFDLSDKGLERAADATSRAFGDTLRERPIDPKVAAVIRAGNKAGISPGITPASEELITIFEQQLNKEIIDSITQFEHQPCIGCPHMDACASMKYRDKPCVKEFPNIGSMSIERFVGSFDYAPIGILGRVTDKLNMSPLLFPFKYGVFVNRGRLITRDGEVKRV